MEVPGWSQFVGLIENVLVTLATMTGSSGVAIIILTIVIKLLLVPLTLKSLRSAKRMQELQPLLKELQRKHGDDRQTLSVETMKLYQERKVNPFGSCLPILLQMPVFFGLYYAILSMSANPPPGFSTEFIWIPNLAEPDPLRLFAIIVTVTQFIQQRMAMPPKTPGQQLDPQMRMMNQMMQFMPLMVGFFALTFPAGPVLYWITQNVFSAIQQYFITGFGSLRDLPRMQWLPVPSWAVVPVTGTTKGDSKVIVTSSKPTTPATEKPSGFMGQLYKQINKRVETIEQQQAAAQPNDSKPPDAEPPSPPLRIGEGRPTRRSSRRARSKR